MKDYGTLMSSFAQHVYNLKLNAIPRDALYDVWIDWVLDNDNTIDPGDTEEFDTNSQPFFKALGLMKTKKYMNLQDVQQIAALDGSDDQYAQELHDAYFDTLHLVDVYVKG